MKVIHFSDLHLDAPFAWMGATSDVARERRNAQRKVLQKIADMAVTEEVDAIFCGGDLYEQDLFTPDTSAFLVQVFRDISPVQVFFAPGNHDWFGPGSIYATARWSDNVHVFTESHLEAVRLDDGLTLWGAAHRAPANTRGFLDGFHVVGTGVHVALFHGAEAGSLHFEADGKQPHAPFQEAQIRTSGLRHAFLGHYHRSRDSDWLTYPGNPEPLTFGEEGERGAVLATIQPDGTIIRERKHVAATSVFDVDIDVSGSDSSSDVIEKVRQVLETKEGVLRVTISGEVAAEVDFRVRDLDNIRPLRVPAWQVNLRLGYRYDLEGIAKEPTVRGEFVREVRDSTLDSATKRRILLTGLRALEGRSDLEVP